MDKEIWPSGLRVLVIDENSSYLSVMEELLLKCCYKVTTFENVMEAMRFICSNLQTVDLIISDAFFPVEDGLLILQQVTSKFDIPTVIMSSNGDTGTVMKYITNGASDFLIKPVRIEELKNIWQHVFRKKIGEERGKNSNAQHVVDQVFYPPNVAPSPSPARSTGITEASMALMDSEVREPSGTVTDVKDLRKSRLSWTRQLHHQFITAVDSLGVEKAVPKKILEVMNVKHLRREQVASHLQKYRLHLRTSTQALHKDDAASSSSHPHESSNLKTQLFDHSPNYVYLNQEGCMEITDYSLPKDDLSSGSDCILDEQNNYSPVGFQDFSLVSDKQASDTYLWNFEAE